MEFFAALVVVVVAWLVVRARRPARPGALQEELRNTHAAMPQATAPITTQRDAKAIFEATLRRYGYAKSSKEHFRETVAEFVEEMKEHVEELRSIINTTKEEIDKQREYRAMIADEIGDSQAERNPDGSDDEDIAKAMRHLGHLDREIAELAATLQEGREALKAFRADRTPFIAAYAEHTIAGRPNPNRARHNAIIQ